MKIQHALTAAALLTLSGLAQAQVDPLHVRSWAASCSACHGTDGRAQPGMESLAGANKDDGQENAGLQGGPQARHPHAPVGQGLLG
jgi:cytochrome c553